MKAALIKLAALLLDKKTGKKVALAIVSVVLAVVILLMSPLLIILCLADSIGVTAKQWWELAVNYCTGVEAANLNATISTMTLVYNTLLESGCTQVQAQWGSSLCLTAALQPFVGQDDFPARLASCFTSTNMTAEELKTALYNEFGVVVDLSNIVELHSYFFDTQLHTEVLENPDTKNNLDLVAWVIAAEQNGWGYLYGTYGQVLDESLYDTKAAQYPDEVLPYEEFIKEESMGRRVADCVGLIKSYVWLDTQTAEIGYEENGMPDIGANDLYNNATEKGTMDTMPETPGLLLWAEGHVGVYIGNGEVVHSAGTTYGVIREEVGAKQWRGWAKIPYIEYIEETPDPSEPSEPTDPSDPSEPTEPTEPTEPDPTEPEPTRPTPALPVNPSDPQPVPLLP